MEVSDLLSLKLNRFPLVLYHKNLRVLVNSPKPGTLHRPAQVSVVARCSGYGGRAVRANSSVLLTVPLSSVSLSPLADARSCGNGPPHRAPVGVHGPVVWPSAGRVHSINRHHFPYKPRSPIVHTLETVEVKSF